MPRYRSYHDTGEFLDHGVSSRSSIDVEEPEPWVNTGLVDRHGGQIMRYRGLEVIGFLSDRFDN